MIVHASIHVSPGEEVKISEYPGETGKYIVLSIGNANIFIGNRAKALEIASLLEKAAQEWEEDGAGGLIK